MIPELPFGRTEHTSSRIIFGSYALSQATQVEAGKVLELLLAYGINHIDTAPMYGNAERYIGSWMENYREKFFIATKTRSRSYEGAWKNLQNSLRDLRVEHIDMWQMHGLSNPQGWAKAMGPGGALEALIEARDKGLVRHLGVTGHGGAIPEMHKKSLQRFKFDAVMLPYNYKQMQDSRYATSFNQLIEICREWKVAVQTIKSLARRPWEGQTKKFNTYFYEPLSDPDAIKKSVHWALGLQDSFVVTTGDIQLLPKKMDATNRYEMPPSDTEMVEIMNEYDIQPIFSY